MCHALQAIPRHHFHTWRIARACVRDDGLLEHGARALIAWVGAGATVQANATIVWGNADDTRRAKGVNPRHRL